MKASKAKKVISIILIVLAALIIGCVLFVTAAKGVNYATHRVTSSEGTDKDEFITLGGMEQYIHIRTENTSNPVIICLHGGPGSPDSFVNYLWADKLDENYTLVFWDQRGAGKTYEHNIKTDPNNDTVSFEQALTDLDELVDIMRERYGQDKVVIMGHSYGTYLGGHYVYDHPEKVSHYIGIGQLVYYLDGEQRSYEDALTQAQAAGDDTSEMEATWDEYLKNPDDISALLAARNFTYKYHQAPKEAAQIPMGLFSPYMGYADTRYFLRQTDVNAFLELQRGLMGALGDDMRDFTDYQVPVDIIMGEYDWTCPTVCAREYYEIINAPEKGFYEIEGCGHSPQFDDPDAFAQTVIEILG